MPKFRTPCNNPFHENWSEHEGEKIVNLRARGLVAITTTFEQYVKEETSKDLSHGVKTFAELVYVNVLTNGDSPHCYQKARLIS